MVVNSLIGQRLLFNPVLVFFSWQRFIYLKLQQLPLTVNVTVRQCSVLNDLVESNACKEYKLES